MLPQKVTCISTQVLDLARRADGLRDHLIELAAKAEPLAAAQAAKQTAGSTAKLPAPEEQLQVPTRQRELSAHEVDVANHAWRHT